MSLSFSISFIFCFIVGQTQSFNVSIRAAENFPLDLYMLVDLSGSLSDDLETIKGIASDIGKQSLLIPNSSYYIIS